MVFNYKHTHPSSRIESGSILKASTGFNANLSGTGQVNRDGYVESEDALERVFVIEFEVPFIYYLANWPRRSMVSCRDNFHPAASNLIISNITLQSLQTYWHIIHTYNFRLRTLQYRKNNFCTMIIWSLWNPLPLPPDIHPVRWFAYFVHWNWISSFGLASNFQADLKKIIGISNNSDDGQISVDCWRPSTNLIRARSSLKLKVLSRIFEYIVRLSRAKCVRLIRLTLIGIWALIELSPNKLLSPYKFSVPFYVIHMHMYVRLTYSNYTQIS